MSAPRTVLVTGAGRGIGRAAVERFADDGWRVVAGVRDVAAAREAYAGRQGVHVARLDVTDAASVREAVAEAERVAGGALDCVVSNAGYAVMGAIEEVDLDEVRAMFETNLFGAVATVQAALPAMREAGGGTVVFVSSVGSRISNPLVGMYHASKYALLAAAEALAVECRPFGVRVASVEPGMVDTDFPRATRPTGRAPRGEGPYAPLLSGLRAGFAAWRERNPTPADEVARAVVAAADGEGPFRVPVGSDADELYGGRTAAPDDAAWHDDLVAFLRLDWPRRRPARTR
ncbi:SDR family NAD(P)-dependent oxidoreductase [Miltoncostaea marina]|uniref:SDR family NAD(P)-dependent oxidoreductase n=1 Tax=Miltoncostaea marina TaxID=2843215 RepID=UPI001C3DA10A|nr:SDR family NAD(P)-dependent oxidoreductase [Miltoncostaea marina]